MNLNFPCIHGLHATRGGTFPTEEKGSGVNNARDPVETKLHTAVGKGLGLG